MGEPDNLQNAKTYPIRLTPIANELLRNSYQYRGDLSDQLVNILENLNLRNITLHRFAKGMAARHVPEDQRPSVYTSVRLPVFLYDNVVNMAALRAVSTNELFNSAILTGLSKL